MEEKTTNMTEQQAVNALQTIALASIKEQRAKRRWKIFFSLLFVIIFIFILSSVFKGANVSRYDDFGNKITQVNAEHIAMVELKGVISDSEMASSKRLSATLRSVAADDNVKGILIVANSPGGSPVQSSLIYQTIRDIKKPVLVAITDMCASGCYYIASAADVIYADKSSIVGSIGVISQSFGYQEAAKKLGIEPRTYTAGKNKDFLNPARKPTEKEIAFLKTLLDKLHQNFISAVKAGREDRLADNPEVFSGLFWDGEQALLLGLIDGIATPQMVAKKIGDYPVYDYSARSPLEKMLRELGQTKVSSTLQGVVTEVVTGAIKQTFNDTTSNKAEIKFQ